MPKKTTTRRKRFGFSLRTIPTRISIVPRFNPETELHKKAKVEIANIIQLKDETRRQAFTRIFLLAELRVAELNKEYKTDNGFYIIRRGIKTSRLEKNYA